MRFRLFLVPTLLTLSVALSLACGSDDDKLSDPLDNDRDQGNARRDGGRDGGDPRRDGSTAEPDDLPDLSPDFTECATSRTEAKRGPRAGNVVWVIDTSGSMDEEAAIVQQNLNTFVGSITSAGLEDYRVVMISEPDFVDVPEPLASDDEHFRYIAEEVGSEEPLSDLLGRFADYESFLLPGVVTHFVVVTDDESEISADDFVAQMDSRLPSEFRVHTIASPPNDMATMSDPNDPFGWLTGIISGNGCSGPNGDAARAGVENFLAANKTSGLTFSICADDWTTLFEQLATEVSEAAVPCTLEVPGASSGEIDFGRVNVVYTPPGGGKAATLSNVGSESSCASKKGWYYDDPKAPTQINLCATSCEAATAGGALDIALGCTTFVQ